MVAIEIWVQNLNLIVSPWEHGWWYCSLDQCCYRGRQRSFSQRWRRPSWPQGGWTPPSCPIICFCICHGKVDGMEATLLQPEKRSRRRTNLKNISQNEEERVNHRYWSATSRPYFSASITGELWLQSTLATSVSCHNEYKPYKLYRKPAVSNLSNSGSDSVSR